jgi:HK97 family phage major capsid protein
MNKLESLRAKNAQLAGSMQAIAAAAEAESRNMSEEDTSQFEKYDVEFRANEKEIENLERLEAIQAKLSASQPRATSTTEVPQTAAAQSSTFRAGAYQGTASVSGGGQVAHNFANHGFAKGFGEYLVAVRNAKIYNRADPRLMVNTISTFGGENVGADGAYALPPQFAQGIEKLIFQEDSCLTMLRPVQTNSNLLVVPTDEDPYYSSSGITTARTAEGGTITASKPVIKKLNVVIHAIKSLVHVSEESLSDIPFLASYIQQKMSEKLRWKMENLVINGTGADEPLGILKAPGLLALTDKNSTATVIGAEDIFEMRAAALPGSGSFWCVSPTVMPQIWGLKLGTTGYPLYVMDASKGPNGTLLGLPVCVCEACPALDTTGDIMLVQPGGYVFALNGGVNTQATIAFAFDQDLQSFKTTVRMGGVPTLSNKVTRANGSTYASNLIALAGGRS